MKPTLPVHLNFMQKAKKGFEIQGTWPLNQFKRLSEQLVSNEGLLDVELKFDKSGPVPFIQGQLNTELQLRCQRCMEPMAYPVNTAFKLGLVLNEAQMDRLPEDLEPYLVEEDNNHLPDMLEDELLLILPLVAMHEHDCADYPLQVSQDGEVKSKPEQQVETQDAKENPFASLKDLLK